MPREYDRRHRFAFAERSCHRTNALCGAFRACGANVPPDWFDGSRPLYEDDAAPTNMRRILERQRRKPGTPPHLLHDSINVHSGETVAFFRILPCIPEPMKQIGLTEPTQFNAFQLITPAEINLHASTESLESFATLYWQRQSWRRGRYRQCL